MIINLTRIIIIHDVTIKYYILIYLINYIVTDFRIKNLNYQDKQIKLTLIDANGDDFIEIQLEHFIRIVMDFY